MELVLTPAQTAAIAPTVQRFSEAEAILQREVGLLLLGMGVDPARWRNQIEGRDGTFVLTMADEDADAREPSGNLNGGILAGNAPGATLTVLFTAGKRGAENLVLYVANIAAAAKTFRLQVRNAAGTVTNYLAFDAPIAASSLPIEFDFSSLRMGDALWTYGSDVNVVFTLFGESFESL